MHTDTSIFHDTLKQNHYAKIPFSVSQKELGGAASAFLDFLRLPQEVKRTLHVPATVYRASADGYTDKIDVENKDRKEFFHYKPWLLDLPEFRKVYKNHPEAAAFFTTAQKLYDVAEKTAYELFMREFPEYVEHIFGIEKKYDSDSILRFLSYVPKLSNDFCAQAHFDKGVGTLALAESAPGLRIGDGNTHPLETVQQRDNIVLFMPAMLLYDYTQGKIAPAWHDVVHDPEEHNITPFCARWAIVFFINPKEAFFHEWDEVHTTLQG